MVSLADVVALLRYEDRQDLSELLADAHVDFESHGRGHDDVDDLPFLAGRLHRSHEVLVGLLLLDLHHLGDF